jgi:hypothetical protein
MTMIAEGEAQRQRRLCWAESTEGRMDERTERSRGGQWRAGRNLADAGQVVYTKGQPFAFRVKIIAGLAPPPTRPLAVHAAPSLIYEQRRFRLRTLPAGHAPNYPLSLTEVDHHSFPRILLLHRLLSMTFPCQ